MCENRIALVEEMELKLRELWVNYHQCIIPADVKLSVLQLFLLKFVQNKEPCTPSDIAAEFGITLGAVTGLVDRLHRLKLVSRSRSEEDRRIVLIRLTTEGLKIVTVFVEYRKEKFLSILESMGEEELHDLIGLLTKTSGVLTELIPKR